MAVAIIKKQETGGLTALSVDRDLQKWGSVIAGCHCLRTEMIHCSFVIHGLRPPYCAWGPAHLHPAAEPCFPLHQNHVEVSAFPAS